MLRPLRPLRDTVVTRTGELRTTRRDALRMHALAPLATERTLVAFPLRDERGIPFDLVLADEALKFPVERWSDVRARLGAGRIELHAAHGIRTTPAKPRLEAGRHALLVTDPGLITVHYK
ncbi:hypothetical protein [Dactylosporangium sp. CS-033363]|uniref:hypothetical protein n=1 Tax=Dactylosporangium sp. CS-033363 TaxID=3239935 RepID=UPI003D89CAB1